MYIEYGGDMDDMMWEMQHFPCHIHFRLKKEEEEAI
jgi:hypothetical protein